LKLRIWDNGEPDPPLLHMEYSPDITEIRKGEGKEGKRRRWKS
jgi:hypothetical protein